MAEVTGTKAAVMSDCDYEGQGLGKDLDFPRGKSLECFKTMFFRMIKKDLHVSSFTVQKSLDDSEDVEKHSVHEDQGWEPKLDTWSQGAMCSELKTKSTVQAFTSNKSKSQSLRWTGVVSVWFERVTCTYRNICCLQHNIFHSETRG